MKTLWLTILLVLTAPAAIAQADTPSGTDPYERAAAAAAASDVSALAAALSEFPVLPPDVVDVEKVYFRARLDQLRGRLRKARRAYRTIYAQDPSLGMVGQSLAEVQIQSGDVRSGVATLKVLADQASDPAERLRIQQLIAMLSQPQRQFNLRVTSGLAAGSNVTNGIGKATIYLWGLPFEPDPDSRQKPGTVWNTSLEASGRVPIAEDISMRLGGNAFRSDVRGSTAYDNMAFELSAGPELRRDRLIVAGEAVAGRRIQGGRASVTTGGVRLTALARLRPGIDLDVRQTVEAQFFKDDRTTDARENLQNGPRFETEIGLSLATPLNGSLRAAAGYDRLSARIDAFASAERSARASWQGIIPMPTISGAAAVIGLQAAWGARGYKTMSEMFGVVRKDKRLSAGATLFRSMA